MTCETERKGRHSKHWDSMGKTLASTQSGLFVQDDTANGVGGLKAKARKAKVATAAKEKSEGRDAGLTTRSGGGVRRNRKRPACSDLTSDTDGSTVTGQILSGIQEGKERCSPAGCDTEKSPQRNGLLREKLLKLAQAVDPELCKSQQTTLETSEPESSPPEPPVRVTVAEPALESETDTKMDTAANSTSEILDEGLLSPSRDKCCSTPGKQSQNSKSLLSLISAAHCALSHSLQLRP